MTDFWRATPRGVRPTLPQPTGAQSIFWPQSWSDVALPGVTENVVLGLPAAWRCVTLIANAVASMSPPMTFAGDGITELPTPPVVRRPNASMGVFDFWAMAVSQAVMRGNFIGLLADFDPVTGFPRQVVPVPRDAVGAYYDAAGYAVYDVVGEKLSAEEVVHVRGYSLPGTIMGIGAVEAFRRSLGQQLDQQSMAAATYRSGSVPSGIIKVSKPEITAAQADQVADQWQTAFGAGQRRPAVLSQLFDFTPLTWSPEDAQFLESRQFSVAEMALMFGLDPSDLGASIGGTSITYQNIESRGIARIVDSYGPWMRRFEEAWSDLTPGAQEVRFVPERLLRMDAKTRAEVHQVNIATGVETVDEARAIERKPPRETEAPAPTEEVA